MLILDKQKAVEHMVALAARGPALNPEAAPAASRGRAYTKVATYERHVAAAGAEPLPQRRRPAPVTPQQPAPAWVRAN